MTAASMTADTRHLERLVDLAREPSSEKRRALLREVSDVFFDAPASFSPREIDLFGDVMGTIAHDVEMAMRAALAERLADVPEAPTDLVRQLAQEDIEVARPLLVKSGVLKEDDLIDIARSRSDAHLKALAGRREASAKLTDVLIERGSDEVLETLARNETAEVSRPGFERLVDRAESVEGLQGPLVERRDLPPDLMNEMFFFVSETLREHILERNKELDPSILEAALEKARRESASAVAPEATLSDAERFIDAKERLNELTEGLLVQLLKSKRMSEFTVGFARLTGLDHRTARRVLADGSGQALAVACKASRFDRSTFSTFVLLLGPKTTRTADEAYRLFSLYDKVTTEIAQRTIRFWRVRRSALDAADKVVLPDAAPAAPSAALPAAEEGAPGGPAPTREAATVTPFPGARPDTPRRRAEPIFTTAPS
jgi:uncharacterized protein (DUF2336 family)